MQSLEKLGMLLLEVERASSRCAGMIRVSLPEERESAGIVMGEKGRICWATSRYFALRLNDLVAAESGRSREELEGIFEASRRNGHSLCELLVERGVLSEERLRATLLHQTASALAAMVALVLDRGARFSSFLPTNGRSYVPFFTFSASELIPEALALTSHELPELERLPETYCRLAGTVSAALCLVETGAEELTWLPLHMVGFQGVSLEEMLDLGRAAKTLVRPPALGAAGVSPYVNLMLRGERGWLVSYQPPHLCLFCVRSQQEYVRLLSACIKENRRLRG